MKGWTKIETGWYTHPSGAVVQRWGAYWLAWRAGAHDDYGRAIKRLRDACAWALDDPRPRQASGETTGYSGGT